MDSNQKIVVFFMLIMVVLFLFGCTAPPQVTKSTGSLSITFGEPKAAFDSYAKNGKVILMNPNQNEVLQLPFVSSSKAVVFDAVPVGNYSIGRIGRCDVILDINCNTSGCLLPNVEIKEGETTQVQLVCEPPAPN